MYRAELRNRFGLSLATSDTVGDGFLVLDGGHYVDATEENVRNVIRTLVATEVLDS